ncbi:tyrosine-type recombinase/integrase [Streptococcus intermedius]|uniref:tyrosine-type recombinase/integrase n=1 Tax=Streptococcus intermedius TaxID=1338 RepID=UPI000C817207|nr:site-specific integrase [Streptococcus intermedius]PMR63664.1 site-specific integrase [Streptococcus intermedius]
MAISYRQRGKKKLWDYRIFDSKKKVIASNSGFRTKKEAELEALHLEIKLKNGAVIDRNTTLYQLWEKWMTLQIEPLRKSDSTLNKHKLRGKFIQKYFQEKPVFDIKASEYQEFINTYAKTNCRDNVSRLNSEVKKVLIFAKRDKINVHNFVEGVILSGRPSPKKKQDRYIHSLKDYARLALYLENHLDYRKSIVPYQLYIQLKTGLRTGEIAGLSWDCVLWEQQAIKTYRRYDTVRRRWTKAKTEESVRVVPVDKNVIQVLKELKDSQFRMLKYYNLENPDNMIFFDLFNGVSSNNTLNKWLKNILQKLNIQPLNMTSTGLRHSYCSSLLAMGIDIWAVSKLMGHKDITEITETYGHLVKEKAEEENNKVRNLLFRLNKKI